MELGLAGKKIVLTGGTRGIGRAMAEAFVAEGAHIAFCARHEQQITDAVQDIKNKGGAAVYGAVLDISDHAALRAWVDQAAAQLGGIDILIANPSAFGVGTSIQDWKAGYDVDLMGTVHAVEAATPHLLNAAERNGDAAILILSSVAVAETDMDSAYGAYKAGLIHYTKGLARRLAVNGVRVNAISPGTIYVEDGFWGNIKQHMPELYTRFFNRNPMQRMGCPKEVAKAAVFLCSLAASFITGANLVVDGGWSARVNY